MLHLGKRLAQVHAVSSRQLVILANLVISLGDVPVIFGLSLIFLDHSIDVSTHDMGNAGPMLLGGVLKLLGRRDRRTLRLFRLGVLGLGRLIVAFFVLLAFVAFGPVLGVLVHFFRLPGLAMVSLLTFFSVIWIAVGRG